MSVANQGSSSLQLLHWSLTAADLFGLIAEGVFAVLVVVVFIAATQ